jgi:hypothetical protein
MSSNNNTIMSIEKFNIEDARVKSLAFNPNNGLTNLDIYIPRIDARYSEDDIKHTFRALGVGIIAYADFVATKDPETKEIKFYSVFARLIEWNVRGVWYGQMYGGKQTKITISKSEFWIVLPAKTPLSRSKVNTHQLAAYTDEVFVKVEEQSKLISSQQAIIDRQSKQIDFLMRSLEQQTAEIKQIRDVVFCDEKREKEDESSMPDLVSGSSSESRPEESESESESDSVPLYCEDECFFLRPLNIVSAAANNPLSFRNLDLSGSFSMDIGDILPAVSKSLGISEKAALKGLNDEINRGNSPENSKRAKISNSFCGNA